MRHDAKVEASDSSELAELAFLGFLLEVVEAKEQLVEEFPESVKYKYGLGWQYKILGDTYESISRLDDAIENYQKADQVFDALASATSDPLPFRLSQLRVRSALGQCFAKQGQSGDTVRLFNELFEIWSTRLEDAKTVSDWGDLGQALYVAQRFAESRRAIEKTLELQSETDPTIKQGPRWWYMAMLLARSGETDKARAYYDQLVAEMNGSPHAPTTRDEKLRVELARLLDIDESEPASANVTSGSESEVTIAQ